MSVRYLYSKLRQNRFDLADNLEDIYKEALKIWNESSLRSFTAHGKAHIDQVEQNLDNLARPLMESSTALSPEEIYVLLAASCLHDIGMQLDEPNARVEHAQYAYDLILYSSAQIGPEERRVTLPIEDRNARQAIAHIARAHWTEFALKLQSDDHIYGNQKGRLRLLGTMLAMADLLDISPVRARYFRTVHRLYELSPLSELHQTAHELVKGFEIVAPNPMIKSDLQFQLKWHTNDNVVRDIADWIMHWFNSQWKQLSPVIYSNSGGTIGWIKPWAKVTFKDPIDPLPRLSSNAHSILKAERAEQRRIDRDVFIGQFKEAVQSGKVNVFLFPKQPDFDGRELSDWCETFANLQENCLTARVDIQANVPVDLASVISHLMEQLGSHLEQCSDIEALTKLASFTSAMSDEKSIVSIIVAERYRGDIIEPLIEALVQRPDSKPTVARVCLLLTNAAEGPRHIAGAEIVEFNGSIFSDADVVKHLTACLGYTEKEAHEMYMKISGIGLGSKPGKIYDYINVHCGISEFFD